MRKAARSSMMTDQQNTNNKPRKSMEDMTEAEISMRKFLKNLGVTTHHQLEANLAEAVASGRLDAASTVDITATISIDGLDFSHQVSGQLIAPDSGNTKS
jgi:hypothetical protein